MLSFTNLKISLRNIGRNPKRSLLTLLAICVAQFTLIWMTSFMNGYQGLVFDKLCGPMLGHMQIHANQYRDDSALDKTIVHASSLLSLLKNKAHVKSVSSRIYAPVLISKDELGHVATITGVQIHQEISEGGLLDKTSSTELPGKNEVMVGDGLAEEMGLKPGDTIAIVGQGVDGSTASGLYKIKSKVKTGLDQINRSGIIMDLLEAQHLFAMTDQVHEISIHIDDKDYISSVMTDLKNDPKVAKYETLSWKELVPQLAMLLKLTESMNLIIVILVFLTTIAGIANTMLMATFERSREFGMLLALGCRPKRLVRILLIESIFLGLSGVIFGSVIGCLIVMHHMKYGIDLGTFSTNKNASFSMDGLDFGTIIFPVLKKADVLRGIIAVIVTSALAVLWPARIISNLDPVEAMKS